MYFDILLFVISCIILLALLQYKNTITIIGGHSLTYVNNMMRNKNKPSLNNQLDIVYQPLNKTPWNKYFSSLNAAQKDTIKNTISKLDHVKKYMNNQVITTDGFVSALYNDYLAADTSTAYGQGDDRIQAASYKIKSIQSADPNFKMNRDSKYLDVGSGDGVLATELATVYKVEDYLLSDVQNYLPQFIKAKTGNRFVLLKPGLALRSDNDVISSFQVLHHAGDLSAELETFSKALKIGGKLLISEHDVNHYTWYNLVLLQHITFEIAEISRNKSFDEFRKWFDEYDLKLTSFSTIQSMLAKLGFTLVGKTNPSRKNATYYSVYIKTVKS
jgi:2-polyprenyl-3-methyl-5-hydroxy-6-metoxy-1,4-benzoquinol methylase